MVPHWRQHLLLVCCLVLAACHRGQTSPNLLIVTLDTTRGDHLGCTGYAGAQTPNLDAFSRNRAVLFTDAVCSVPITLPSHTTIMTGTYPVFHGVHDNDGYYVDEGVTTLAEILAAAGYSTAAFIASFPLDSQFNLDQGFAVYDDDYQADWTPVERELRTRRPFSFVERRADGVNRAVFRWLQNAVAEPFFVWVHYFDPHSPYRPPPPYNTQLATSPYDGEIAFMDEQLGHLLDRFASQGLLDNTAIVMVGDHGEGLNEHGEPSHASYLYDSTMRVPLLIAPPRQQASGAGPAGRVVRQQVRTVDVAPTALAMLGLPLHPEMQGRSLLPLLRPEAPAELAESEALLESHFSLLHFGWAPLRALRHQGWKYIEAPRPELYDLVNDPGELDNLAQRQPQRAGELAARLAELAVATTTANPSRSAATSVDEETRRKLAALGYITGSSSAKRAGEFPPPEQLADMVNPRDRALILRIRDITLELIRERRFEDAIQQARRGLSLDPDNPPLLQYLGTAQSAQGNYDKALVALRRAAARQPGSPRIHSAIGEVLRLSKAYPEAVEELTIANRLDPTSVSILLALAMAQGAAGDDAAAITTLEQALDLDASVVTVHVELAKALWRSERLTEARTALERALELDPPSADIRHRLGALCRLSGDTEAARELLSRAVEIAPDHIGACLELAEVLLELGETAAAQRLLHHLRTLAPPRQVATRVQELLATTTQEE